MGFYVWYDYNMPRLIVIRGPSGSGKTSISEALLKSCKNPTLLIHEDEIRLMFNNWKQPDHSASKDLAVASILSGIKSGYDVIYEGIANIKTYDIYFQSIFKKHPNDNYFYFIDVSFEECLKRHNTRIQKDQFGATEMQEWIRYASPTGYESEIIIPENSSLENTVKFIIESSR